MSNYPPGMTRRDLAHVYGDDLTDDELIDDDECDDVDDDDWDEMHNIGR